jgi:hypothetical protein
MDAYYSSIATIWVAGFLLLSFAGLFLWHRRENTKAKSSLSGEREQLAAVSAQLAELQARITKIEKVLASVD